MHSSTRFIGQFGRTFLKESNSLLNKQQQQKFVITLTCQLNTNTPNAASNSPCPEDNCSKKSPACMSPIPAQKKYSKFTAAREGLPLTGTQLICEERALDLISNLKETELAAIKLALKKYEAKQQKEAFEGKFGYNSKKILIFLKIVNIFLIFY